MRFEQNCIKINGVIEKLRNLRNFLIVVHVFSWKVQIILTDMPILLICHKLNIDVHGDKIRDKAATFGKTTPGAVIFRSSLDLSESMTPQNCAGKHKGETTREFLRHKIDPFCRCIVGTGGQWRVVNIF